MTTEEPIMRVDGVAGQIELYTDRLKILRKGIGATLIHGFKGEKEIMLSDVSSIQYKKAGFLSGRGYIQFAFRGGTEAKRGLVQAASDENSVLYKMSQQKAFDKLKDAIYLQMSRIKDGTSVSVSLKDLEKLAELRDKGILTESEFEAKKKQILGLR